MSLIPCAKKCIHQTDGYCTADGPHSVMTTDGGCAYYEAISTNDLNSLADGSGTDDLDGALGN